jgi:hypothetical protein
MHEGDVMPKVPSNHEGNVMPKSTSKVRKRTRWDGVMLHPNGTPKKDLPPKAWFCWCVMSFGGIAQIARDMGVSRQTIYASWHGAFPDKYVVRAEKLYGIPRRYLAPHLYE